MQLPAPFDQAFLDDMPYDPSVLMLDRIEELDRETKRIVCRMPTDRPMPFTNDQRVHEVKHPLHVSGAVMVHVTGMLGFVHQYYIHERRHADGWTGYGTHIRDAVFRKMAVPGEPLSCACTETRVIKLGDKLFCTYLFEFRQGGELAYESKQSAMWIRAGSPQPD